MPKLDVSKYTDWAEDYSWQSAPTRTMAPPSPSRRGLMAAEVQRAEDELSQAEKDYEQRIAALTSELVAETEAEVGASPEAEPAPEPAPEPKRKKGKAKKTSPTAEDREAAVRAIAAAEGKSSPPSVPVRGGGIFSLG
jgi:hypothetical protein